MFEMNERVLPDGTKITTYSTDIESCNILEVEAGTTGYMGGDSGYGCRTYFRIKDAAATDIAVYPINDWTGEGFEVVLGGDTELRTIVDALKFIVRVLEKESQKVK